MIIGIQIEPAVGTLSRFIAMEQSKIDITISLSILTRAHFLITSKKQTISVYTMAKKKLRR
jgi:hypothetical protein